MNPPPDFMVPVGLDRFVGALRSCNRFLCFKKHLFQMRKRFAKTRVRVACETFVEARRENMNQMLKNGYNRNWGEILQQNRIFFPDDFLYPKVFAAFQRLSLSARSSAARTVETMPPRKWKQMW